MVSHSAAEVSVHARLAKRRRSARCAARMAQRTLPEKSRKVTETAKGGRSKPVFFTNVRGASVSFLECDDLHGMVEVTIGFPG